jgi:DNA-binding response OmpR family regulator
MNDCAILLVEDDDNDVFFFEYALSKADVEVALHVVRDGQQAMDYLSGKGEFADRQLHPLPRLAILDLNLPRKHGLDVLRFLRTHSPASDKCPIVVLTSSNSERDIRDAYHLGANSYLVKPGDTDALVRLVKLIHEYWLGANRLPDGD